jgi:DNA polymerase elongation subunit (family B)
VGGKPYLGWPVLDQFRRFDDKDLAIGNIVGELPCVAEMMHNDAKPIADAAPSGEGFLATVVSIVRNYGVAQIGRISIDQLTSHMILSRPLDKSHDRMTPHVAVARRIVARGPHVGRNTTIAFVIARTGGKDVGECARIPDEVSSVADTDVESYVTN